MLITKFNKLIRNKFIWAIFAILVSLSMVGLFAPQPGGDSERHTDGPGTLFGEPVSREAFFMARAFAQSFQPTRGGEEAQKRIDEEAWRRLAMLRYARKLGLQVSDTELVESIRRDPSFAQDGVFSRQLYQQLVHQQLGIPVALFEDYIREEILINRLRDVLDTSLWIAASDLEENAARFTDTFSIAYVLLEQADHEIQVSDADALALYEEAPERFRQPEQRSVFYVAIEHDTFLDPARISDRQIEARYEANARRYTETDPETQVTRTRSLDEVADEIREELAMQEAMAAASEQAMRIVDELSLAEAADQMRLEQAAKPLHLIVQTSPMFEVTGQPPEGISAGRSFNQAAFRLSPTDPALSFSFSIPGTNAVYVLQLKDVVESHIPPFEQVAQSALEQAREAAQERAFSAQVDAMHQRIREAATDEEAFRAVAAELDLVITDIKPFALYDADPLDIPFFRDMAPEVLHRQTGEITHPIPTSEGTVIAYIIERTPGSFEERMAIKPDINRMMRDSLDHIHFTAWIDALLLQARQLTTR